MVFQGGLDIAGSGRSLPERQTGRGIPARPAFCALRGLVNGWPPISKQLRQDKPPALILAHKPGSVNSVQHSLQIYMPSKDSQRTARYRLGLRMTANSIGWCAVHLDADGDPAKVLGAGVRVFSPNREAGRDPRSESTFSAKRCRARAERRRRDRFVRRRTRLMETLVGARLMPAEEKERKRLERLDPYWLRRAALDERIEPYELGRAIFHLNQRRGRRMSRIDFTENAEIGAVRKGVRALEAVLEESEARTLGELLANWHGRDKQGRRPKGALARPLRFRPTREGTRNVYALYPTRDLVESELDRIWESQRAHHAGLLTPKLLQRIKRIVIEQRPYRRKLIGRCALRPKTCLAQPYGFDIDLGERAPKAHPLYQRFRILRDLSHLRVVQPGLRERHVSIDERDALAELLMARSAPLVFYKRLRRSIGLPENARFSGELAGRKGMLTDKTAASLARQENFGPAWRTLTREQQIELVERLLMTEDESALCEWLSETHGLDQARALGVSAARLPQGHFRYGRSTLSALVEVLERESTETADPNTGKRIQRPLTFREAMAQLGGCDADTGPVAKQGRLPYYGEVLTRDVVSIPTAPAGSQERIGRLPKPAVHIGLNQVRKIVNALIDSRGAPCEIVIELAPDLKWNAKEKSRQRLIARIRSKREKEYADVLGDLNLPDTREHRLRLELDAELPEEERVCVYTGDPIPRKDLFTDRVEIDHVLPFYATLDDSFPNRVLCTRAAKRMKRHRAPGDAWNGKDLKVIAERAERLFAHRARRFAPDAMHGIMGFADIHFSDKAHTARSARHYLESVCPHVKVTSGRLTDMLRANWDLNALLPDSKHADTGNPVHRSDHRHGAIDAFVLACMDRRLLERISTAARQAAERNLRIRFPRHGFPMPFKGYREDLADVLRSMVVSHKPDRGVSPRGRRHVGVTSAKLLQDTAFGPVDETMNGKRYNLVSRTPIQSLTAAGIPCVRDPILRRELYRLAHEADRSDRKLSDALAEFGERRGIRRVRVLRTAATYRLVEHGSGYRKAYLPAANHCIEIFELPDGQWDGEGVSVFDVHQPGFTAEWRKERPDARPVMKVHAGDLIEADFGAGRRIYRICTLDAASRRLKLAPHFEGGPLRARYYDKRDPFRYEMKNYTKLMKARACLVHVSPLGRVMRISARPRVAPDG